MVNLKYILLKLGGTIHLIFNIGDSLASYPELGCGTFNVNGLGDTAKRQEVLPWIENKNDDIVLLQETHIIALILQNGNGKIHGMVV